ncbi:hypothetical protein ANCDUO_24883 [Ancylostoma duodenale]|uniref:Uncharacterized protein n=1 Tax=Ancylostoma duodenale TaxID=51022 RepID=A0A0C2FJM6_9BILA|nr:hypothetical protein ANCDUO_24883 [Ancylostoma duodenale]
MATLVSVMPASWTCRRTPICLRAACAQCRRLVPNRRPTSCF